MMEDEQLESLAAQTEAEYLEDSRVEKLMADYDILKAERDAILARLELASTLVEAAYREGWSTACGASLIGPSCDDSAIAWTKSRAKIRLSEVTP